MSRDDPRFVCALEDLTVWLRHNSAGAQQRERERAEELAKLTPEQKRKLGL